MLIPFVRQLITLQLCPGNIKKMKLWSRLFKVFVDIYTKNVKFGYLSPVLGNSARAPECQKIKRVG